MINDRNTYVIIIFLLCETISNAYTMISLIISYDIAGPYMLE